MTDRYLAVAMAALSLALAACGGGGGGDEVSPTDGGTGDGGEESTLLRLAGLAGAKDSVSRHVFTVPAGAKTLAVQTTGGSGNVDLAVSGPASRACESISAGNVESCTMSAPPAGIWQVGLLGTDSYEDVTLTVVLTVPAASPPPVSSPPPSSPPPAPEEPPASPTPSTPTPSTPAPSTPDPTPAPSTPVTPPVEVPPETPAPAPAPSTPETPPVTTPPVTPPVAPEPQPEPEPAPAPPAKPIALLSSSATYPRNYVEAGGRVFFIATSQSPTAERLWITDATSSGTRELSNRLQPSALAALGSSVLFTARDPDSNQPALWQATTSGTVRLLRTFGTGGPRGEITLLGAFGNKVYFIADDGTHGHELWSSDGSSAGTQMIADIDPRGDARFEARDAWTWWNGRLYFYAGDRDSLQLYSTDGSAGSLQQLTRTDQKPRSLSGYDMAVLRDRLYFTWHSAEDGVELWSTDGTPAGTKLFFDAMPGRGKGSDPGQFNVAGSRLLFFAQYPGNRTQQGLFASDGTVAGTTRIARLEMPASTRRMVRLNGQWLFPGRVDGGAYTLWSTDGTAAGTRQVSAAVQPAEDRFDGDAAGSGTAVLGNRLLFLGRDAQGFEPWVTDGSAQGTQRLADLNPGAGSSFGTRIEHGWVALRNGKAYFTAALSDLDHRLYETDGTPQGTREVIPDDATVRANTRGRGKDPLPAPFAHSGKLLFAARFYAEDAGALFVLR